MAFRAENIDGLDNLQKNSVDFYASVRSVYTQDRENKIKNLERGNIEVIYNDDWEEIERNNKLNIWKNFQLFYSF